MFWGLVYHVYVVALFVIPGVGFGLMYLCALVAVAEYFDKRRGLAVGIVSCGSGLGGFIFAPLSHFLISQFGWKGGVLIISGLILNGVPFGLIYRPVHKCTGSEEESHPEQNAWSSSRDIIKYPPFVIFCVVSIFLQLGKQE